MEHDDALIAAVAGGDDLAFTRLVGRHAPRVYAVARRQLGNDADADEATQEVFWRVFKSARRWQPGKALFTTWLYRVTINVCLDSRRTAGRRREVSQDEMVGEPRDQTPGQDVHMASRQELANTLKAIDALPPEQRMALVLSVQQNLSNREIAAAMDASEGAVEQLLVRARRTLRESHRSLT